MMYGLRQRGNDPTEPSPFLRIKTTLDPSAFIGFRSAVVAGQFQSKFQLSESHEIDILPLEDNEPLALTKATHAVLFTGEEEIDTYMKSPLEFADSHLVSLAQLSTGHSNNTLESDAD